MPEIEKSAPATEPLELESFRAANFMKIYANSAQVESSIWDVKITFGEITKVGTKLGIEQSVQVSMSPQHAKALLGVLAGNLREYEKRFGEINVPQPAEKQRGAMPHPGSGAEHRTRRTP